MFKFVLGALSVAVLVGYGIITTEDVEGVGRTAVTIINDGATYIKESTDPTLEQQIKDRLK